MDDLQYAEGRYKDGLEYAKIATQYEQQGHFSAALTFYSEAVEALNQACDLSPIFTPILPRVEEYAKRAFEIREYVSKNETTAKSKPVNSKDKHIMHQLEYLMEVALLLDEEKRFKEAANTYTSAVDLALKAQGTITDSKDKAKVGKLARKAIERLEEFKKMSHQVQSIPEPPKHLPTSSDDDASPTTNKKKSQTSSLPHMPLTSFLEADPDKVKPFNAYSTTDSSSTTGSTTSSRTSGSGGFTTGPTGSSGPPHSGRKGEKFSEKEIKILRLNSKINGVLYYPWSDSDLSELRTISALPMDFVDPDGLPALAEKQKARLAGWQRPGEICENPRMAHLISSFSIKQTLIGDCSFVASLGVCADYERRFKKRLITKCIYPQNRHGEPIINPNGKYFIRLYLNGCHRKIVIDDRLPVDVFGNLLCSHSNSKDEFWISLLEKAYMKVMGGYDFPGSSSNNDLNALTGWIPERIDIKQSDPDKTFRLIETKLRAGNALITMGTGPMSSEESERCGLVPTHAYAVLRVVNEQGRKLLQLKNPWSEKRWKGSYSEKDFTNWTPELKRALSYDQSQAQLVDNGVFWIDWDAVRRFYDTLYMNWNPDMFHFKYTIHDFWKPGDVEKDLYNISNNPQYALQVNCTDKSCTVWVLISRHITTKSDFAHNEKFITLHVANSKGRRLYLPPRHYVHTGVKINTPHYLVKLTNLPHGTHTFTIIVSQLESLDNIYFTIKVYSTCKFTFGPVPNIYSQRKELKGQWKAGHSRPTYKLTLPSLTNVMIELKGPRKFYVWLALRSTNNSIQHDSGPARPGITVMEVDSLSPGEYIITPTTYTEGQEGPFFITAFADGAFDFQAV